MTTPARAATALVTLNIAIYFVMFGAWVAGSLDLMSADRLLNCLALPSSVQALGERPRTLLTYMFTHVSFLHLTVNMLWLVAFGAMFRSGWRPTVYTYVIGGIAGAVLFLIFSAFAGITGGISQSGASSDAVLTGASSDAILTGASSAVIAIVVASTVLNPGRRVRLLLLGDVQLKWVAPVALLTLFGTFTAATAAHLGGMIAGGACGLWLRRTDRAFTRRALSRAREMTERRRLLDKAASSGYASLSRQEQLALFNLSAGSESAAPSNTSAPNILYHKEIKK